MTDTATTPESNGTVPADSPLRPSPEALGAMKAASLPIGTVEDILNAAPKDLVEDLLQVPEWGFSVRVRSLTAAQQAKVKQASIDLSGKAPDVVWAAMERVQFGEGVVEPAFTPAQVEQLHRSSGPGFARVIAKLDEISGMSKEELRKAQNEFRESDD